MHSVSTAQCEQVYFSGEHFANPVMSQLREWCLWRAPIGWPCTETSAIAITAKTPVKYGIYWISYTSLVTC